MPQPRGVAAGGGVGITLCHESDLHINAARDIANVFFDRWTVKGYSLYAVESRKAGTPAG